MRSGSNITYAAMAMLGLGGLLVFLAWNGAASVGGAIRGIDYTQGQIPFLISGGIGGLALIGAGLALLVIHSVRRDLTALGSKLDLLIEAVRESGGVAGGPTAVPGPDGAHVVAGRTTYHTPSCHVVEGRSDLQVMGPKAATERGLAPCRVCEPAEVGADGTVEIQRSASA